MTICTLTFKFEHNNHNILITIYARVPATRSKAPWKVAKEVTRVWLGALLFSWLQYTIISRLLIMRKMHNIILNTLINITGL